MSILKKIAVGIVAVTLGLSSVSYCDSISIEYIDFLESVLKDKTEAEKELYAKGLNFFFANEQMLEHAKEDYRDMLKPHQEEYLKKKGITDEMIKENFEILKTWSSDDRKKLVELVTNNDADGIVALNSENSSAKNNSDKSSSNNSGGSSGGGTPSGGTTSGSDNASVDNTSSIEKSNDVKAKVGFISNAISVKDGLQDKSFKDIKDHWAKDYVEFFASRGIINGKTENSFSPDDDITKAEIVKIVASVFVTDPSTLQSVDLSFKDIKKSDWYYSYVETLTAAGVLGGSESFEGNKIPSREEIIDLMVKTLKSSGISVDSDGIDFKREFKDTNAIDSKYRESVVIAENLGIINGVGENLLDPKSSVTRAQVMALTKNLYDYILRNLN